MIVTLRVKTNVASSAPFMAHHGVPSPGPGDALVLGPEFAQGGFGAVHPVEKVGRRAPTRKVVAKVFDPDALARTGGTGPVIDSTRDLHVALDQRGPQGWPDALLALSYALLTVDHAGRETLVAMMLDLRETGHEDPPFAEPQHVPGYLKRPPRDRIEIALRFAERAALLETVGLLHGDLNPENLLIHPTTLDVQIIDFDAGVIVTSPKDRPRTAGKPDDCMPPEVKVVGRGVGVDLNLYTRAAERWSVGSLVGYCLFGAHPGFFLRSISRKAIDGYSKEPRGWPEVDVNGPLFTSVAQNQRAYLRMRGELQALPSGAQDAFKRFFSAGLDGSRRPTAGEWHSALSSLREKPKLDDVRVDQLFVVEGGVATVTWVTRNATHVELRPGGRQPANGTFTTPISGPTRFMVKAVNAYGEVESSSPVVRTVPLPRIDFVPVPTFPDLSFATTVTLVPPPAGALAHMAEHARAPELTPLLVAATPTAAVLPAPGFESLFHRSQPGELPALPSLPDLTPVLRNPLGQ